MVQRLDELLQFCTVKITIPGQMGWGTGFFVAPGLILTCAHVVKALPSDTTPEISWQQQEGVTEGTIACVGTALVAQLIPEFDLALLQVSLPQAVDLPCVYLDGEFQPTDNFYTYGYPDSFPDGASVTSQCEGSARENGIPLILFKSGLIRPGFSGSPLLNLRPGKVCGIVKFTRDRSIDLGGGAIPAQSILQQVEGLIQQQQSFHQQDDRWSRLLPEPQSKPLGVPFPRVRLPENYVDRPHAVNAVKAKLLDKDDDRTLVVSAISGLGGLGKSVLATALVLDQQVQQRFKDGILWVTLGQNPDLQTMLGEWIRELDKSREAFSANTLEAASRYLDSLLAERRMLLVVDDVWNAAHVKWFQVGSSCCRVLVTTREAVIPGADRYSLNLMSPQESLALIQAELGEKWTAAMEQPALEFARLLGYLPLALRLMAIQVARGRKWETLKKAFLQETERLRSLDQPGVRLAELSADERRQYSLRACFQLSLDRLKADRAELFERFVWLGVLPEDVEIQQPMAMVLWDIEDWEAEETLLELYERSFLTSGVATREGEATYRVHDLMHDMAQSLIKEGTLDLPVQNLNPSSVAARSAIQNLPLAHRQFIERYRERAVDQYWDKLPNDGYIHRHLTWHMEQADWADELHALMSKSDEQGRGAWFEACDRIGQPAIFVEDVARGWRLADQGYVQDKAGAIALQCRYALITATLNSLISNLPVGMMAEFVKRKFWTVEQAWSYVEQMQDEEKIAEAIQALAPYLSKPLFQVALETTRSIQPESRRAEVLSELAKLDGADFTALLEAARSIQPESRRAEVLSELAKLDGADFTALLEAARSIQDEYSRAVVLSELAKLDGAYFTEALETARSIQSEYSRAVVLRELAKLDGAYFTEALEAARSIQSEYSRAWVLRELAKLDGADFTALLETARSIQDEYSRAVVLSELAQQAPQNFLSNIWKAILDLTHKPTRAQALSDSLSIFPIATLPYSDWQTYLHLLAHRRRSDLMQALATLYPAIVHLGGKAAMRGVVDAIREVCSQWK